MYGIDEENSAALAKKEKLDESKYGIIRVPTLLDKKVERDFADLRMVQDFAAHKEAIWVAEFSPTCEFLATGGKWGNVKIWRINGIEYDDEPYSLFEEEPYRVLQLGEGPNSSILDISWCMKVPNMIVVARLDWKAILWDINHPDEPLGVYEHNDAVTWVSFHPDSDETQMIFLTGCLDKTYQIWSKTNKEPVCSQQARDYITALSVSPDGVRVVIGCHTGQLIVCAYDNVKLNYITSIECKNRMGKYSKGTKVTSIVFLDNTEVLVTTNDSRIRIVNVEGRLVNSGSKQMKFKGHRNDNLQIRACISEDMDYIICGSEDGYVYVWNKYLDEDAKISKERNDSFERFVPFAPENTIPTTTTFLPLSAQRIFMHKYALCGLTKILK